VRQSSKRDRLTSRHLDSIADRVRSGAHLVLRGHLGDEVLVEGKPVEEAWGIADALSRRAGIERVFVASQADGLYCQDPHEEEVAAEFFGRLRDQHVAEYGDLGAALYDGTPTMVAAATRLLLRQAEQPVAIVIRDGGDLFGGASEQGRAALGLLLEAMAEASFVPAPGGGEVRNALIVYGQPDGPAIERIASLPGVVEEVVEAPNRAERLAGLRHMAKSFFRGDNGGRPAEEDIESLAGLTDGYSLRELIQLCRGSHAFELPATRPQALYRRSRSESAKTPIGEIGVERIMAALETEIFGQPAALEKIREQLTVGQWRPASRPARSRSTRPMATMVLHGPTGVGKTETSLILAEAIGGIREAIVRIDCAELRSEHDVARLLGAPPGFVGYDDGGALTEALERDAAVIVFDEFDMAPALTELLLGILDAGRLTDGRGRTATFENALLVFTTNLGFKGGESKIRYEDPPTPGALLARSAEKLERRISGQAGDGFGSPALWSRLQGSLVGYDILREEALAAMVDRACENLERNLADELGHRLALDRDGFANEVQAHLTLGWDGRSVAAEIQRTIETPVRLRLERNGVPRRGGSERIGPGDVAEPGAF